MDNFSIPIKNYLKTITTNTKILFFINLYLIINERKKNGHILTAGHPLMHWLENLWSSDKSKQF